MGVVRKYFFVFVTSFLLLVCNSKTMGQHTCGCYSPRSNDQTSQAQIKGAVRDSETVFSGKVSEITTITSGVFEGMLEVHFDVDRSWKKMPKMVVTIITGAVVVTQHSVSCGYPFEKSERYLVFVERRSGNRYFTGRCSRTKKLSEASDEIAIFGKPKYKVVKSAN